MKAILIIFAQNFFFDETFFRDLEKRFFGEGRENILKDFEKLFENLDLKQRTTDKEWQENEREKILVIKGMPAEKSPFKITIKDKMVTISGTVEVKNAHSRQLQQFKESFSVPMGTDVSKVRLENKKDQIHIIFPKLAAKKVKGQRQKKNHPQGTRPLESGGDLI